MTNADYLDSESKEMLRIIKGEYLSNLVNVEVEGRTIAPPKCLPWQVTNFLQKHIYIYI